ncbi:flavodoxin family protein [Halioglobus maricola]|uniref:Flavodoxin family protein n=1 Tax=Halioglobus maricola TaxID=2601894 RepID=A0A5P9NME3_9GAMM|nr:NAD(P)H-dependent oxidoreductase [Halioglobus maricola]QFU76922.1 flavodoxin family protein [Halioglobus maricola]
MTDRGKRILILFAHPSPDRSEVNVPLAETSTEHSAVTFVDLYREYPDLRIDIDREQQQLREHDVIVFMFPLYWYSTPAILKEWQDLVLEYGFAYGAEGRELHGKTFLCAITAGGTENAYHREGFNHFEVRELLVPLENTAGLTGMHYLPPYVLFGARTAVEEGRVSEHIAGWQRLLDALAANTLNLKRAAGSNTLNDELAAIAGSTA